jgi:hypothetical protein
MAMPRMDAMLHAVTSRLLIASTCGWLLACDAAAQDAAVIVRPPEAVVAPAPSGEPPQSQPAEQALQDVLRLQSVEREVRDLRELARQNTAALQQMSEQLAQAQGDRRTASLLLIGLATVLTALLAWLAVRWNRVRQVERVGRWFELHGGAERGYQETLVPPMPARGEPRPTMPGEQPSARGLDFDFSAYDALEGESAAPGGSQSARGKADRGGGKSAQTPRRA